MPLSQSNIRQQVKRDASFDHLALVLEARHGVHAAEVADFFASVHGQLGDHTRSLAWDAVADTVRQREAERMAEGPERY
ncbi:MAG: hypothetical protein GC150_16555 [Rhizobiales bacterium]|nr:hypothetical protein [Hyphomicrobiales bacterium]